MISWLTPLTCSTNSLELKFYFENRTELSIWRLILSLYMFNYYNIACLTKIRIPYIAYGKHMGLGHHKILTWACRARGALELGPLGRAAFHVPLNKIVAMKHYLYHSYKWGITIYCHWPKCGVQLLLFNLIDDICYTLNINALPVSIICVSGRLELAEEYPVYANFSSSRMLLCWKTQGHIGLPCVGGKLGTVLHSLLHKNNMFTNQDGRYMTTLVGAPLNPNYKQKQIWTVHQQSWIPRRLCAVKPLQPTKVKAP